MNSDQAQRVLEILSSTDRTLKGLARLAGRDEFDFYRGADMMSLNLAGQDLTGMNFDKADLRFSNLDGVKFDKGAFNGSILDKNQNWLADEFEFYANDVMEHPITEILIFCRLRGDFLEPIIKELGHSYADFSGIAEVSSNALRKARNGAVIAHETALKIVFAIGRNISRTSLPVQDSIIPGMLRQPFVEFLSGGTNIPFKHVSRIRLHELYRMRAEIVAVRELIYPESTTENWRDTPEFMDQMISWYREHRTRIDAAAQVRTALEEANRRGGG